MMIGQVRLLSQIDSFIEEHKLPRVILLIGERGCGKKLIVSYISQKLGIEQITLNDKLNIDFLNSIAISSTIRLYVIDGNALDNREQNMLLKFLEEPMGNSYVIINVTNTNFLLNTIVNRCYSMHFDKYTDKELLSFIDTSDLTSEDIEIILSACDTPGKIKEIDTHNLKDLYSFTEKIINNISKAKFGNALLIADKLNYKDEYDKFNIDIFLSAMLNTLKKKMLKGESNNKFYNMFIETLETKRALATYNLNIRYVIEKYISKLWQISREGK